MSVKVFGHAASQTISDGSLEDVLSKTQLAGIISMFAL